MKLIRPQALALACLGAVLLVAKANAQLYPPRQGAVPNLRVLFSVVGQMHNIDPALLEAMAAVESYGDPNAISPKGALGLMQLMPATAEQFSVPDAFDPVSNLLGAAYFIDYLRGRIGASLSQYSLPELLAAYNAGPKAVEKFKGVPPYPETRNYIQRVLTKYQRRALYPPATVPRTAWSGGAGPWTVSTQYKPASFASNRGGDDAVIDQLSEIRRLRARYLRTQAPKLIRRAE